MTGHSEDTRWVVKIASGQESVVARTSDVLLREDIVRIGFEQAQRAMDIVTFESNSPLAVSEPGGSHIILFPRHGDLVVQHVGVSNLTVGMHTNFEIRDKDGNLAPQLKELSDLL